MPYKIPETAAAKFCEHFFGLCALGLGDHWKLSEKQAKDLGEALTGASGDIPPGLIAAAKKHGGLIRLGVTGMIIVYPRVQRTIELRTDPALAEQKRVMQETRRREMEQRRRGFSVSAEPPGPPQPNGFAAAEAAGVEPHTVGVRTNGSVAPEIIFKEGGFVVQ